MGGLFRGFVYFLVTRNSSVTEGPDKDDWYLWKRMYMFQGGCVCLRLEGGKWGSEKLRRAKRENPKLLERSK